jgi:23S rRNA pseudouridine2605 synthase
MDKEEFRLQLYMARCGVASRRKCEDIISQARISVNGKVVMTPGTKVTEEDTVTMDGRVIKPARKKIYLALHKPTKFLCSTEDPDGRSLAIDLIAPAIKQRVFNVGRLDYLTSGLIFFTNDGEFAKKITHPSSHVEKEYVVTTKKSIPIELMESFEKGIYVGGEFFKLKSYKLNGSNSVNIVLEEGKNRELRKVFQSENINVKKVHRIRIGNVKMTGLNSGHFRHLTEREIKSLLKDSDSAAKKNEKKKYTNKQRN